MRALVAVVFLIAAAIAARAAAPSPAAVMINDLENQINRQSLKGQWSEVRELRLRLADLCAHNGFYTQAARQYEVLLASRPRRRERVRLNILLGKVRDAVQDYGGSLKAYGEALHDDPKAYEARLLAGRAFAKVDLYTS